MKSSVLSGLLAALLAGGAIGLSSTASAVVVGKNAGATTPTLSDFSTQFQGHPRKVGYGNSTPDSMFLETFQAHCPRGQHAVSARFDLNVTKLTQGANRGDNDALSFWDSGSAGFTTYLWAATDPPNTTKTVSINLQAMPTSPSTGVIVASSPLGANGMGLLSDGDFSFSVQDDTRVNSAQLTYECGGGPTGGVGQADSQAGTAVSTGGAVVEAARRKGMTWGMYPHHPITGTATAACQGQPGPDCNAYVGDTMCTDKRPVLCIDRLNLPNPAPNTQDPAHWSGGVIASTPAVPGMQFATKADVDQFCKANFGPAFEVAEFHMQPGRVGWKFGAYGNIGNPGKERVWVHIDDQPNARCWN